ncbi:uncharacterized protein PRCAT00003642001 [Priceomyces carsonii]|uniref:uncharacterized protein n=1 Tax=Priceomyces carsonii TaxID=28549 RepID=UPI002ED8AC60|nr:unnamed protein product [Priceomyces carsonii]
MKNRLSKCEVCKTQQAKYKCPVCKILYCSIDCFKNVAVHNHENLLDEKEKKTEPDRNAPQTNSDDSAAQQDGSKFLRIILDSELRRMLQYDSLQFHLLTLMKIINDISVTNEPSSENRKEIANMKLCDLRSGGLEANQLVEEFVQRFLYLYDSDDKITI